VPPGRSWTWLGIKDDPAIWCAAEVIANREAGLSGADHHDVKLLALHQRRVLVRLAHELIFYLHKPANCPKQNWLATIAGTTPVVPAGWVAVPFA
jgi:hypothetical protein